MADTGDGTQATVLLIVSEERVDEYLGVGYLATALRRAGFRCDIFQWPLEAHRAAVVETLETAPAIALVGVTWLYDSSVRGARAVAEVVKRIRPDVPVVIGGHPPSLNPEQALHSAPDVDLVLRGEADFGIVELTRALRGEGELHEVTSLAFRDGASVVRTKAAGQIRDLDALGWPERDTLRQVLGELGGPETIVARMCSSRGCYARCEFCSMVSFYNLDDAGMKWRSRDPGDVAAEMAHLSSEFAVRRFWFVDDEFLGPTRDKGARALAIASSIVAANLDIEWGFDTRANGVEALPQDGLERMRDSGLRVVAMGLESGSQVALKRLNKGMRIESNWAAVRRLRAAGIDHRYGFIMYDPETTLEDLALNVEFLRFADPHRICNTGPFRLLNAEYPEVGTVFALRLGVQQTTAEALQQSNKPKLSEAGLGYDFRDDRVSRLRQELFTFATEVVEPAMIPRPAHETALQSDVWWQGTNYLPQNVASMRAFLDVHAWALSNGLTRWATTDWDDARELFATRLRNYLAVAPGH